MIYTRRIIMKSALRIRVVVGHQRTGLKPALRHVPVILGLASPLLLPIALVRSIPSMSRCARRKFRSSKNSETLLYSGERLGGNNQKEKRAEMSGRRRALKTYGSSALSSCFACCLACCCASWTQSLRPGEDSRMRIGAC